MKKLEGFLHSIEWSNPYTEPPAGAPRVLAEVFALSNKPPKEFDGLRTFGGGYSQTIRFISAPANRQLSQDSLKSVRRKRLERRVNSKVPMFADHFIEQEISKKQEYYDGITDENLLQAKYEVLAREAERYQHFTQNINRVFIYGNEPAECKEKAARLMAEMSAIRGRHLTMLAHGRAEASRQSDVIQQPEQIPLFQADTNPAARR